MACRTFCASLAALLLLTAGALAAQDGSLPARLDSGEPPGQRDPSPVEEDLAKQLQNPVANLLSVAFQSNFDVDLGSDDEGFRYTLNVQPVIPFDQGEDWLIITRTILPIVYQNNALGKSTGSDFGLGDTLQSFFLSPKDTGSLMVGFGPAFLWPTATDDDLGGRKWGAGPTGVALVQSGPWTLGFLANHVWSYAGAESRPGVSQTFLQPFAAYTLNLGTTFFVDTEATYDWREERWAVPVIAGISQVLRLGEQHVSLGLDGKYWVEGPGSAADWGIRFVVTLIFPR